MSVIFLANKTSGDCNILSSRAVFFNVMSLGEFPFPVQLIYLRAEFLISFGSNRLYTKVFMNISVNFQF